MRADDDQDAGASPRDVRGWLAVLALAAVAGLAGCADGRSADDPEVRYGCATQADCLAGFTCCASLCHPSSQLPDACGADTAGGQDGAGGDADGGPTDASVADATADAADTAATDAGPEIWGGACSPTDWTPCGKGNGCYYQPSQKKTFCQAHGDLAEGAACDKKKPYLCGTAGDRPLLCDEIDAKCYRTCFCTDAAKLPCPANQKCYCLEVPATKEKWPDGAGICAP